MSSITDFLKKIFARVDAFNAFLSRHWDPHTNRRTIIILLLGGGFITAGYWYYIRPPDAFPANKMITVATGTPPNAEAIAESLKDENIIQSPFAFRVIVRLLGADKTLQGGDYIFKEPKNVWAIARSIAIGAHGLEPITIRIPEGATSKEIAKIFSREFPYFNSDHFLQEVKDNDLEGYLFPDTYNFLPNVNEDTVIKTMEQDFNCRVYGMGDGCIRTNQNMSLTNSIETFGKPISDIITMASILEKEGTNLDNRRMISGILWNRLAKGMPLQVDAAFLYSIGKSTPSLTKKDLRNEDDPYNTYKNKGLPPTAIGSPSISSIIAAVTPIKTDDLFYLSDASGTMYYSATYAQHCAYSEQVLGKKCN